MHGSNCPHVPFIMTKDQKNHISVLVHRENKMPRLNENLRNRAIGMLVAGMAERLIARRLNCHASTVSRLQIRFQQTGAVADQL